MEKITCVSYEDGREVEKIKYKFSEKDRELLSKSYPKKPCKCCLDSFAFCSCERYLDYLTAIQPLQDSGLWGYYCSMERVRLSLDSFSEALDSFKEGISNSGEVGSSLNSVSETLEKLNSDINALPRELVDLLNLMKKERG